MIGNAPRVKRRVYQDLALKIADRINSGKLTAGTRLPSERALAHTFGVSRASVREAMVSLQA
ncbi:MAG: GntR family transcriptional regulator, partial [Candidatus Sulfotelmatobacter sp.]